MIIESLKSLAVPIDSLQALPGNPRRGDVDAVATSLSRFGQRKPIVVRRDDGTIIAGNHTWQAAKKLGWLEIAVAYVGDDDVTAQAYALADNRTAELGDYDDQLLKALIDSVAGVDPELLKDTGWSDDAVKELLEKIESENPKVIDEDEVPELPVEAKTKLGDLYHLGRHRLLCGDSTDESNIKKLCGDIQIDAVVTDPPYGIGASNWKRLGKGKVNNNVGEWDNKKPNISWLLNLAPISIIWGGNYFTDELPPTNDWLCWHKKNDDRTFSEFELAWTNLGKQCRILQHHWSGEEKHHITMKPQPVMTWCLDFLDKTVNILDPFGGSGSTLIAANQTQRTCFILELNPQYCDVIIQRWETLTGEKAVLISNAESTQA